MRFELAEDDSVPVAAVVRVLGVHQRDSGRRTRAGTPKLEVCDNTAMIPDHWPGYLDAYCRAQYGGTTLPFPGGVALPNGNAFADPGERHAAFALALEWAERHEHANRAFRARFRRQRDSRRAQPAQEGEPT